MLFGQNGGWFSLPFELRPGRRAGLMLLAGALAAVGAAQEQTATESVVLAFGDFPNGEYPYAPLFRAANGALYGTTYLGGAVNLGIVFELSAAGYKVLYSFRGGTDGANPYAGVIQDSAGNLYGTTYQGGAANAGVVYKINASGQETVLYSFTGGADGGALYAGVIADSAGNLYGTTYKGGITNCSGGCGVVYKVTPSGQETVLYSFTGGADGASPHAGVISDSFGNLYGTTYAGGSFVGTASGNGVVYELEPSGQETALHAFAGPPDGEGPVAGVIRDTAGNLYGTYSGSGGGVYKVDAVGSYTILHRYPYGIGAQEPNGNLVSDSAGNLYGTTQGGGPAGEGIVYEIDAAGKYQELYAFPGGPPGEGLLNLPNAGIVLDAAGEMYGTTCYAGVAGMVYKRSPSGQETTLYSFRGAPGGTEPRAGVIRDSEGNLYGDAVNGGPANAGVVYKVDATGHETVLYSFTGGADGAYPQSNLIRDSSGNIYGTTPGGGLASGTAGFGVVYKVDTAGHETVLYTFTGGADGGLPEAGVVLDAAGNLYGTTAGGGASGLGVVYEVDTGGQETVLHSLTGGADGAYPEGGVILDAAGNLYGTASSGGARGGGVVFKLGAAGQVAVLYAFPGGASGDAPHSGLVRDSAGNFYGSAGGGPSNQGVVYRLAPAGHYAVLYAFTGKADGGGPMGGVAVDSAGNVYGTTEGGGTPGGAEKTGYGVVYKLAPSGQEVVLHSFTGGADGANPYAGVVADPTGDLYGTTPWGGRGGNSNVISSGAGLVYRIASH